MAKTPDSLAGGPGFKSLCRPTNLGAHPPYTPPPGRKDASRVPRGMVYVCVRESRAPGMTKKIIYGIGKTKRQKKPEEKGEILVLVEKKRPIVWSSPSPPVH